MTFANSELIGVSNCIFSHCYSFKGAGIYLYVSGDRTLIPMQFCFFTQNSGTYGNDVFAHFLSTIWWDKIFLHSYTTGSSYTLGENGSAPMHVENNWIPQSIQSVIVYCSGDSSEGTIHPHGRLYPYIFFYYSLNRYFFRYSLLRSHS